MNQEKQYYREEDAAQLDAQNNNASETDDMQEINDMKFFLELIECMRTALESGSAVPFTNGKRLVNADKCLAILDDMEKNLPAAVQYGLHMYSEQDRIKDKSEKAAMDRVSSAECQAQNILKKAEDAAEQMIADAKSEADALIADAQERADHMVSNSEILTRANEDARKVMGDARLRANETRLKANQDAYALLSDIESYLSDNLSGLRQRVKDLAEGEE